MYPLYNFDAILCDRNINTGNAGDKVLQRDAPLAFLNHF